MKFLKIIACTFLLSFILPFSGVKAEQYYCVYNQVSIPSSIAIIPYTDGDYLKMNDYIQAIETFSWSKDAQANIKGMISGTPTSGWKDVKSGKIVHFGSGSAVIGGVYRLELKSKNILFGITYSGSWTINMPNPKA